MAFPVAEGIGFPSRDTGLARGPHGCTWDRDLKPGGLWVRAGREESPLQHEQHVTPCAIHPGQPVGGPATGASASAPGGAVRVSLATCGPETVCGLALSLRLGRAGGSQVWKGSCTFPVKSKEDALDMLEKAHLIGKFVFTYR